MTRLGHMTMSGALAVLALTLTVSTHAGRDDARPATWGSTYAIQDPDPGSWLFHPSASSAAARTYAVGMSRLAATSRITVLPNSAVELTNRGASGVVVLESGGLTLTDAESFIEVKRGSARDVTDLAAVGIRSTLQRGDRLAFGPGATMVLRNQGEHPARVLAASVVAMPGLAA